MGICQSNYGRNGGEIFLSIDFNLKTIKPCDREIKNENRNNFEEKKIEEFKKNSENLSEEERKIEENKNQKGEDQDFNFDKYDEEIMNIERYLLEIEEIRYEFSKKWGDLLTKTGIIVLKNPELNSAIYSLCYQLINGGISKLNRMNFMVYDDDLYYDFPKEELRQYELWKNSFDSIKNYLEICYCYKNPADKLCEEFNELLSNFFEKSKKIVRIKKKELKNIESELRMNLLGQFKLSEENIAKKKEIEKINNFLTIERKNRKKINIGFARINEIVSKIKNAFDDLKDMHEKFLKEDPIELEDRRISEQTKGYQRGEHDLKALVYILSPNSKHEENIWKKILKWILNLSKRPNNNKIKEIGKFKIEAKNKKKKTPKEIQIEHEQRKKIEEERIKSEKNQLIKIIRDLETKKAILNDQRNKLNLKLNFKDKIRVFFKRKIPLNSWNISLLFSRQLDETKNIPKSLCFINEKGYLIVGLKSGAVKIFQNETFEQVAQLGSHNGSVNSICYLNDGKSVFTGSKDGSLKRWDIISMKNIEFDFKNKDKIISLNFHLIKQTLFVFTYKSLYCFDVFCNMISISINLNFSYVKAILIKSKEKIAVGLLNGKVKIFDYENYQEKYVHTYNQQHQNKITDLTVIDYKSNDVLVSASKDGKIFIYGINDPKNIIKVIDSLVPEGYPIRLMYGNDEKTLISTYRNGKFCLVNYEFIDKKRVFYTQPSKITCIVYANDGSNMVIGYDNGMIEYFVSR